MTGTDGGYQCAIGSGPSRELTVAYRPDQRELTAGAELKTKVHPTFRLQSKVVKNKTKPAAFTGSIPGPDNEGVVVLQVKDGKGWRAFRRYRTRKSGRYTMRYLFTQTDRGTTYIMRAEVGEPGYPTRKVTRGRFRFRSSRRGTPVVRGGGQLVSAAPSPPGASPRVGPLRSRDDPPAPPSTPTDAQVLVEQGCGAVL